MNKAQLQSTLEELLKAGENEVVEFKEAKRKFDTDRIGKYFSALCNEANLRGNINGWLVFGVNDKKKAVVGTDYRRERLQSLKQEISAGTEPSITFRDILELEHEGGRVVMMQIPAAPVGLPIAWKGQYFGRAGDSLVNLSLNKLDDIRNQTLATDWSARIVPGASLDDLDELACRRARAAFAEKYDKRFTLKDVQSWPLSTFLDRARVTQSGEITRTALLLLGRPEIAYKLSPHPAEITWKLQGPDMSYEHFGPPFFLATRRLVRRIRNVQIRLLPEDDMIKHEISKYDRDAIYEALHNCIVHQDYERNCRIVVTEYPSKLTFENEGAFFEGTWEDYIGGIKTPREYRNAFLRRAMTELNMIDTVGHGIHRMFDRQRRRYLPLPDYDLSEASVCLTLHGTVVDPAYTQALMQHSDLELHDVLALDRVQKRLPIPKSAVARLRRANLVEGRQPNLYVSASVASTAGDMAPRPLDNQQYQEMVVKFVGKFECVSRREIDDLLWEKLGDELNESQKKKKIENIINRLSRSGRMVNVGSRTKPSWKLGPKA